MTSARPAARTTPPGDTGATAPDFPPAPGEGGERARMGAGPASGPAGRTTPNARPHDGAAVATPTLIIDRIDVQVVTPPPAPPTARQTPAGASAIGPLGGAIRARRWLGLR